MFKDLVKKDRSYRGFDESCQVTREQLEEMVDCTRYCPMGTNIQPLRYYLACDSEIVGKIQPITKWGMLLPEEHFPHEGHRPTAFIVICQDLSVHQSIPKFQKEVGIAAQTILLCATEMGLGGCMIGNFNAGELKRALSLPEEMAPQLVLGIGKPDETIVVQEVGLEESTNYYRDENGVHYVPKRRLRDIIIPE
jgi:nitroreductase